MMNRINNYTQTQRTYRIVKTTPINELSAKDLNGFNMAVKSTDVGTKFPAGFAIGSALFRHNKYCLQWN